MVPGGLVDPFLPAFGRISGLRPIVAAQEGGAAYMADGYARASGRFGACLVIGGPGITNTVTAMEAARTDGSPVIMISGQVPTNWEGRGGFQDSSPAALDDISILRPLCNASYAVENPHLLSHHLGACLRRMLAGPQGPVHLSLPTDIQKSEIPHCWQPQDGLGPPGQGGGPGRHAAGLGRAGPAHRCAAPKGGHPGRCRGGKVRRLG